MEDHEKAKLEKFTFADALDAAQEWVFNTTKCGWLFLIGIFLVVIKVTGSLGAGDTPWINVLWPFLFVAGAILVVALVFDVKYDFKVVGESEVEAKEYKERLFTGKKWNSSGVEKVILEMRWVKKK